MLIGWAGFSLFFAAWLQFQWGGGVVTQRFDNLGETLAALIAAAVCGIAAWRHRRRTRIAWALIGASALSWGLGQAIWSYYELVLEEKTPFPSLADLGYLAMIPLMFAGLVSLPGGQRPPEGRIKVGLDAFIVMARLAGQRDRAPDPDQRAALPRI